MCQQTRRMMTDSLLHYSAVSALLLLLLSCWCPTATMAFLVPTRLHRISSFGAVRSWNPGRTKKYTKKHGHRRHRHQRKESTPTTKEESNPEVEVNSRMKRIPLASSRRSNEDFLESPSIFKSAIPETHEATREEVVDLEQCNKAPLPVICSRGDKNLSKVSSHGPLSRCNTSATRTRTCHCTIVEHPWEAISD